MTDQSGDNSNLPIFNVLQIVALNMATSVFVLAGLRLLGSGWKSALLGASFGGSVFTLVVAIIAYGLHERRSRTRGRKGLASATPPLVPKNISDPMQLWEADRLMERDFAGGFCEDGPSPEMLADSAFEALEKSGKSAGHSVRLSSPKAEEGDFDQGSEPLRRSGNG